MLLTIKSIMDNRAEKFLARSILKRERQSSKFFPRLICVGYTKRVLLERHFALIIPRASWAAIIADNVTHGSTSILVFLCQGRKNTLPALVSHRSQRPLGFRGFPKYCCCIISTLAAREDLKCVSDVPSRDQVSSLRSSPSASEWLRRIVFALVGFR